jgi:hypothetical protein
MAAPARQRHMEHGLGRGPVGKQYIQLFFIFRRIFSRQQLSRKDHW